MSQIVDSKEVEFRQDYTLATISKRENFIVIVEKGQDGFLVAKCDELGVVTQGKTLEEIQTNVIDAIETALEADGDEKEFSVTIRKSF